MSRIASPMCSNFSSLFLTISVVFNRKLVEKQDKENYEKEFVDSEIMKPCDDHNLILGLCETAKRKNKGQ